MIKVPAVLLAVTVLPSLLYAQSGKVLDKTYSVNGRASLQVLVDDSSIRAQGCGSCREVRIHVDTRDLNLSDFRLQEQQSGNQIRFSFRQPEGIHWHRNVQRWPQITIMLPTASDASLHSGDGSISIANVSGLTDLRAGDGSISAADTHGPLQVSTGDGSITLHRAEGTLSATTGDGSLSADGRFEKVDARTGDGSVQITADEGSTLSSGVHITAGDGSVVLRIPRTVHADVDLRSGAGAVRCDLPLLVRSGNNDQHLVRGTLNGGGSPLQITAGDGSVSVGSL